METMIAPEMSVVPPAEEWRSIHDDSRVEAEKFKWIESERAGHDVGERAIRCWVQTYWWGYLRARWLQHIHGKCFWIELDRDDYGILQRAFPNDKDLLAHIVDHLRSGGENLGIIIWAMNNKKNLAVVREILETLDINSRRLVCRFESRC